MEKKLSQRALRVLEKIERWNVVVHFVNGSLMEADYGNGKRLGRKAYAALSESLCRYNIDNGEPISSYVSPDITKYENEDGYHIEITYRITELGKAVLNAERAKNAL